MKQVGNEIAVKTPVIRDGLTLQTEFAGTGGVADFLRNTPFFARYSMDIRGVPESILAVPLLATLAPVAWVCGAKLYIGAIDRDFYQCLSAIKKHLAVVYPRIPLEGEVIPARLHDNSSGEGVCKKAMLFSGGVDSWGTLLRKKAEEPILITVNGADVKLKWPDAWEHVRSDALKTGMNHGLENLFVTSNFRHVLDHQMLDIKYRSFTSTWWEGIQSGMGMLGLMAPVTFARRVDRLYIATCQPNAGWPWDAQAGINNNMRWASTTVEYEGGGLTRQGKIGLIADYVRESEDRLDLRVCYKCPTGGNCGVCRKCAVTAIGLLLEGIEPEKVGLPFGEGELNEVRSKLERHEWSLELSISLWREIQETVPTKLNTMVPYARDFFSWYSGADLNGLILNHKSPLKAVLKKAEDVCYQFLKKRRIIKLNP